MARQVQRWQMVRAVRQGQPLRRVARRLGVSLCTVQRWVARAAHERLDRVDWANRPPGATRSAQRTSPEVEDLVLRLRQQLKDHSAAGEYGAVALHQALQDRGLWPIPCVRTLNRILRRRGILDARPRVRRPPPPRGWYLPDLAQARVELDSFDIIAGLVLRGGLGVEVLTAMSLHGGLCAAWPCAAITAKNTVEMLVGHWQSCGLPGYAQFDNDTVFQGAHQWPDSFGRVIRVCLSLGVVPVFAPPRETGFQAAIENFNGRWQAKVWSRFQHASRSDLRVRSARFIAAVRQRSAARLEAAPARAPFPKPWPLDWRQPLRGKVIFLRRTSATGTVSLLGHAWRVDPHWAHRLVRAEVDLDAGRLRCYALRRREPTRQPLLLEVPYHVPTKTFEE